MAISDIAKTVMEGVTALVPDVQWEISTRAVSWQGSPPRVVWTPSEGAETYDAPMQVSNDFRALFDRRVGLTLHIWGRDTDSVEELIEALISELWHLAPGSLRVGPGQWIVPEGALTHGDAYRLSVSVDTPCRELPVFTRTTITTTAFDPQSGSVGDGALDTGERGT